MKKPKISLYIPEAKKNILKGVACNRNISMNSLIVEALDKMYGLELFFNPTHTTPKTKFSIQKNKETKKD